MTKLYIYFNIINIIGPRLDTKALSSNKRKRLVSVEYRLNSKESNWTWGSGKKKTVKAIYQYMLSYIFFYKKKKKYVNNCKKENKQTKRKQ